MATIYLFVLFLIFYVLVQARNYSTDEKTLENDAESGRLYGGGGICGFPKRGGAPFVSQPAPAKPRMSFQYPYTSPWDFYQSPWLMYRHPEMLSREAYYRNLVPNYYS